MQEKRFLDEYSIKEIYLDFFYFEEKFSNIINNTESFEIMEDNEFYSKLKFVKALNKYKKQLEVSPYIHKYSESIINEILDTVQSVKTQQINENVEFDNNLGQVIFNKDALENQIFDDMILPFTEVGLKNVHTQYNGVNYNALDKARIEYISDKLRNFNNSHENRIINMSDNVEIYTKLVDLFGEERMLNLNSSNISKLEEEFKQYNGNLEWFEEDLKDNNNFSSLNNMLDLLEKNKKLVEFSCLEPTDKAKKQILEFKKVLYNCKEIPEDIKQKMLTNLEQGVKDVEEKKLDDRYAGLYYSTSKKVQLDNTNSNKDKNEKYKNILHEFMHAATTSRDKLGRAINIGLCSKYKNYGNALNEGATEYFAQKMYSTTGRPKVYIAYPELVAVFDDLVHLYGKNIMLDAMINGPDKIEELMEKDGKNYSELLEISEDYYKDVYCNKNKISSYKLKKELKSKEMYARIGCFIEEIKTKRQLQTPEKPFEESKWKEAYYDLLGAKKSIEKFSWFKRLKNVIKDKFNFNKKDEVLMLNEGASAIKNDDESKKAFKSRLQVNENRLNSKNNENDKNFKSSDVIQDKIENER